MILKTKKEEYFQGEDIIVEFANACANKTILVVKNAVHPGNSLNMGDRQYATVLSQDSGEVEISSARLWEGVDYKIQAYFTFNPGPEYYMTGVSNTFTMTSRL